MFRGCEEAVTKQTRERAPEELGKGCGKRGVVDGDVKLIAELAGSANPSGMNRRIWERSPQHAGGELGRRVYDVERAN